MKKLMFLIAIFCVLKANAQDYLITFTGAGASSNISMVKVENLTAGTFLTIYGSDILHLTSILTGVSPVKDNQLSRMKIYPNPMTDNSTLEIIPPVAGNANITIRDMIGKPVFQIQFYLENINQDFRISGLENGFYLITVKGNGYQFSGKLISNTKPDGTIRIEKTDNKIGAVDKNVVKTEIKGIQATIDMKYTTGDRLKFTGISGNYSTVKIDIPVSDRTVNFNFTACTDGDNNNYPVVTIGTQTWMAENLKTTKFNDGTNISLVTDDALWKTLTSAAYCWLNNDEVTNKNLYGALYNWYAVNTVKLCPSEWHVPTDSEWTTLTNYLRNNGYGIVDDHGVTYIAKAMAGTSGWAIHTGHGATVGDVLANNNSSGFTALPGGQRSEYGYFGAGGFSSSWWTTSETILSPANVWNRSITYNSGAVLRGVNASGFSKRYGYSVRCLNGEMVIPTLTTSQISAITKTTASSGGVITIEGGADIIGKGVCWSTSENPTIADTRTMDFDGLEPYTSSITGLKAGTTYYVRAYATNRVGTNYGNQLMFTTKMKSNTNISDADGNIYDIITIGSQIWMAENLRTTKYNDGTAIPLVTENAVWAALTTPGYCWYNNDAAIFKETYGSLYNWYTVNTGKLCPYGWHVPGDEEWKTLEIYLGMTIVEANNSGWRGAGLATLLKALYGWADYYGDGTDDYGFSALPAGNRYSSTGEFENYRRYSVWWSSTIADGDNVWVRNLIESESTIFRGQSSKKNGASVRCLKD